MSEDKWLGPSPESHTPDPERVAQVVKMAEDALATAKRKPGRPKGAKNKSTLPEPEDMPMHMRFPHPNELRVMLRAQVNGTDSLSLLAMLVDVLDSTLKLTKQKLRKKALRLCR